MYNLTKKRLLSSEKRKTSDRGCGRSPERAHVDAVLPGLKRSSVSGRTQQRIHIAKGEPRRQAASHRACLALLVLFALFALSACKKQPPATDASFDKYDDWADALGYFPNSPAYLPGSDFVTTYTIENADVAKAIYTSESQVIIFRTAKGLDRDLMDLSGYEEVGESTCKGFVVPVYGKGNEAHAVQWSEDGKSFAVFFQAGVSIEFVDEFIKYV